MKGDWRAGQYVLYIAHLDKKEHVFCQNGEYWQKITSSDSPEARRR
jgi:hypothetical protein